MNKKEIDLLEFTMSMSGVRSGEDVCQENPLARATKKLFSQKGQPFKRINQCFFQDPEGCIRWLGIFVYSIGDRILFFPGYSRSHDHLIGYRGESLWKEVAMNIDHISLEKDRLSWHITSRNSNHHVGKIFTKRVSNEVRHWFSLSVSGTESLRVAREKTIVSVQIPSNDVDRRIEVIEKSRQDAIFQLLSLNNEYPLSNEPTFFHFSVFVGTPGFPIPENSLVGMPNDGEFANDTESCDGKYPVRIYRIEFTDFTELMVIVSAHRGTLKKEFVFTGLCATDE